MASEDLIPALCGFPTGADWPVKTVQQPTVTVWIVKNDQAKLDQARRLCAAPTDGKTFLFTYRLPIGERAAKMLGVPFVFSKTKRPLEVIDANDTVVISSVGNEGLSFPVRRAIELDFLYGSGMEAGQRLGRLAYEVTGTDRPGEHHVLMTPDEYERHHKRLMIYYQWGLDVSVQVPDNDRSVSRIVQPSSSRRARRASTKNTASPRTAVKTPDEISEILALPSVAARIAKAQESVGASTAPFVTRVFRLCFHAAFSPAEISEGKGLVNASNSSRYRSACRALRKTGLFSEDADGRFQVNQDEIARLRALSRQLGS